MARDSLFHARRAGNRPRTSEQTSSRTAARAAGIKANVDWTGLRQRMRGALLRPGDPGFEDARKLFNPLNDDHVPAAVAQCESVADVREGCWPPRTVFRWLPAVAAIPMSVTRRRTGSHP